MRSGPGTPTDQTINNLPPEYKTHIRRLGVGAYGEVHLFDYNGQYVAIKLTKNPDDHEHTMGSFLLNQAELLSIKPDFVAGQPIIDHQGILRGIKTDFIYYDDSDPTVIPSSADLESFIRSQTRITSSTFNHNVATSLAQLSQSLEHGLTNLHKLGVFHFDTSTRNFLVDKPIIENGYVMERPLKINDFGLSEKIQPDGTAKVNFDVPHAIRLIDTSMFSRQPVTVSSDLFALKCTLIGMTGLALGNQLENDALTLSDEDRDNMGLYIATRYNYYTSDEQVLNQYIYNVDKLIQNHPDQQKAKYAKLFLDSYREFVTTMSEPGLSFAEKSQRDHLLFLKSNEKFLLNMVTFLGVSKVNKVEIFNTIKQLHRMNFTAEFKRSSLYQQLEKTTNTNNDDDYLKLNELMIKKTIQDEVLRISQLNANTKLTLTDIEKFNAQIIDLFYLPVTDSFRDSEDYKKMIGWFDINRFAADYQIDLYPLRERRKHEHSLYAYNNMVNKNDAIAAKINFGTISSADFEEYYQFLQEMRKLDLSEDFKQSQIYVDMVTINSPEMLAQTFNVDLHTLRGAVVSTPTAETHTENMPASHSYVSPIKPTKPSRMRDQTIALSDLEQTVRDQLYQHVHGADEELKNKINFLDNYIKINFPSHQSHEELATIKKTLESDMTLTLAGIAAGQIKTIDEINLKFRQSKEDVNKLMEQFKPSSEQKKVKDKKFRMSLFETLSKSKQAIGKKFRKSVNDDVIKNPSHIHRSKSFKGK